MSQNRFPDFIPRIHLPAMRTLVEQANLEAAYAGGRKYTNAQNVPAKTVELPKKLNAQGGGRGVSGFGVTLGVR